MLDPKRWTAKKAARLAVATGSVCTGRVFRRAREPHVRALTYHRFGSTPRDPFCLGARDFEAQIRHIADRHLAVSLDEVLAFVHGERDLDGGSVLVTIDDGDASIAEIAAPILARYHVPAVAFVVVGDVGKGRAMGWDTLRSLRDAGVVIGSHSLTHRSMTRLPPREAEAEARRSRDTLEDQLGHRVDAFAYPYGTRADYNARTNAMLAEAGYACGFTSQHGSLTRGLYSLALPRVKVEAGDPSFLFPILCAGALDAWSYVDRALYRIQRPID